MATARHSKVPLILSGGLSAENVAAAIAATDPYAIDSASGTEAAPGRKDRKKLRDFIDAAGRGRSPARDGPDAPGRAKIGQPA